MGRSHPGLARGKPAGHLSFHIETNSCRATFFENEIGDTSLPLERPEMLDDELLKQLHHVLLEVSRHTPYFPSPSRRLS